MMLPPNLRFLPSGIYVDASFEDERIGLDRAADDSTQRARPGPVTVIAGRDIRTKQDFLRAWAETFGFPAYFGMNWDAFADTAPDLTGLPPGDHLIIYDDFEPFAVASPADWAIALRIFPEVSASWQSVSRRVVVLMQGPLSLAPNLPLAFS